MTVTSNSAQSFQNMFRKRLQTEQTIVVHDDTAPMNHVSLTDDVSNGRFRPTTYHGRHPYLEHAQLSVGSLILPPVLAAHSLAYIPVYTLSLSLFRLWGPETSAACISTIGDYRQTSQPTADFAAGSRSRSQPCQQQAPRSPELARPGSDQNQTQDSRGP